MILNLFPFPSHDSLCNYFLYTSSFFNITTKVVHPLGSDCVYLLFSNRVPIQLIINKQPDPLIILLHDRSVLLLHLFVTYVCVDPKRYTESYNNRERWEVSQRALILLLLLLLTGEVNDQTGSGKPSPST